MLACRCYVCKLMQKAGLYLCNAPHDEPLQPHPHLRRCCRRRTNGPITTSSSAMASWASSISFSTTLRTGVDSLRSWLTSHIAVDTEAEETILFGLSRTHVGVFIEATPTRPMYIPSKGGNLTFSPGICSAEKDRGSYG